MPAGSNSRRRPLCPRPNGPVLRPTLARVLRAMMAESDDQENWSDLPSTRSPSPDIYDLSSPERSPSPDNIAVTTWFAPAVFTFYMERPVTPRMENIQRDIINEETDEQGLPMDFIELEPPRPIPQRQPSVVVPLFPPPTFNQLGDEVLTNMRNTVNRTGLRPDKERFVNGCACPESVCGCAPRRVENENLSDEYACGICFGKYDDYVSCTAYEARCPFTVCGACLQRLDLQGEWRCVHCRQRRRDGGFQT